MNNYLDFNEADQQQIFDLIPAGTVVSFMMAIKPGGVGEGGWFTASKTSDAVMLSCEFTVTEGPYAKRKFWQYLVLSGGKLNDKGESIAAGISRSMLRAMLESARNVKPDDMSDAAVAKRRTAGWHDFNGLCFLARLGVEKGQNGYQDKNRIQSVITPDMKEYAQPPQVAAPAADPAPAGAPSWGNPPPPPAANSTPVPSWAR